MGEKLISQFYEGSVATPRRKKTENKKKNNNSKNTVHTGIREEAKVIGEEGWSGPIRRKVLPQWETLTFAGGGEKSAYPSVIQRS